ncbi:GNAT family N-acetyltransferase [Pseudomonas xantholysinigenes]|uniref:GNAT family N-acetyltransferase n=1 Tax=Pseudomonas xantholysinigenes TaxID=2745490 RepID=A0A9E6Q0Y5_9PSED|nr:GNAT family N-acetyltransferase [Pseudomonas xantholysinigenes]QXI40669.1 GNAT family N-acetyltransferase [Pseudomonas xantholysinigenes]
MQPLTLRKALPQDALCLAALGLQVFLETYATQGMRDAIAQQALDVFSVASLSKLIEKPGTFIIVAQIDHHLVGFAQVAMNRPHERVPQAHAAELQRLYLQARFTGLGIGKRLLEAAEQHAARNGATRLWATVWAENQRALDFYLSQGYEALGAQTYTFQQETHANQLFGKNLTEAGPLPPCN